MMLNRLSLNRIGLNRIGLNRIGKPSGGSSDRPYIDPKVLDSLCGVWIMDQNTNESESRNIIKNKIADRGGDLELLNFGYKLNSGYSKYELDFNEFTTNTNINTVLIEKNKDTFYAETLVNSSTFLIYKTIQANNTLTDTPSFKAKVEINKGATLQYRYINSDGVQSFFNITEEGEHEFPISYNNRYVNSVGVASNGFVLNGKNTCRITQIPSFQGALVTDGKDDMIVSQKTVQEMLGGSNEVTVVSMIHQIGLSSLTTINNIRSESVAHVVCRNICSSAGKTGIYGYSKQINTNNPPTLINNILGDKKDYTAEGNTALDPTDKFFVQGYKYSGTISEVSPIAYYWTFISNKTLTTDQINQVISYFNLDKHVKPDIIYDTIRQGITNENHASFNDELVDFSGNGHNMKIFNSAWKLGSGVGKYNYDYKTFLEDKVLVKIDDYKKATYFAAKNSVGFFNINFASYKGRIKLTGVKKAIDDKFIDVFRIYTNSPTNNEAIDIYEDGIYDVDIKGADDANRLYFFALTDSDSLSTLNTPIIIEQISDYEGALVSDGIDDYGYADNLPIFKDYTVAIDRAWINLVGDRVECLATKNSDPDWGAFNFELSESITRNTFSFGGVNRVSIDVNRKISYQSKYSYNGATIATGNIVDGKDLFLFRSRSAFPYYAEAAIWSYILFPYSLSEFLLERQLKRYKLGTLYPDMVEFRPVIKSNSEYQVVDFYIDKLPAVVGKYYPINSALRIAITTQGQVDEVSSIKVNGVDFGVPGVNGNRFTFNGTLSDKSPQKIDITIDEYIRYEDIVQPYPAIINLKQDGKTITWGDKLKVGSDIVFVGSANLLPELYTVSETRYNGVTLYPNTIIKVEKSMVFDNARTYLKANEPSCILSPNRLRIPNSSYKILGYIPDLTGKGNHGRLNNFAYTEESGANEDGSIRFDGTDDHITIPTLAHGAKQVLMKVNLQSYDRYLYDQRNSWSQYLAIVSAGKTIAYEYSNKGGKTYIDGILNKHIIDKDLLNITHNITATNANIGVQYAPNIGTSFARGNFAQMALFDFMLFPEISSEEEIQELNDIVGIEGGYVERPEYYWDAYGKTNSDADRATIIDQVSKDPANALTANNFAFNEESGYVDNGLVSDGVDDNLKNTNMPVLTDYTWIMKRKRLDDKNEKTLLHKGDGYSKNAFLFEFTEGGQKTRSFGHDTTVVFPDLISYQSKNNYNGQTIESGDNVDGNVLHVFMGSNNYPRYTKAVFYKAMLYSKTIDTLSINMLKNLFEKDELIDVNNPIFKKQ